MLCNVRTAGFRLRSFFGKIKILGKKQKLYGTTLLNQKKESAMMIKIIT